MTTSTLTQPSGSRPGPAPDSPPALPRLLRGLGALAGRNVLLLGLILLAAVFQIATGLFWTAPNLRGVALDSSVLLIIAVPAALLLISGYIDLSIGSTVGLGGVVAGVLLVDGGVEPIIAVVAAIAVGALVGVVNGVLVAYVGLSPLIVTLGTLSLAYGAARGITDTPKTGFPAAFSWWGGGRLFEIPVPAIIAAIVAIAGWLFATQTAAGRHVYAVGANRAAAYLTGLPVRRIPLLLYVAVGAAAGFGGAIIISRIGSAASGTLGVGFEISVLTALLLAGIGFAGGSGSIVGVVIGVLFLGVLQNGLALLGIPSFWQHIATGAVLVIAAGLNFIQERRRLGRR